MSWLSLSLIHRTFVSPAKSPDLSVLRFLLEMSRLLSDVGVLSVTLARCVAVTSWQLVMAGSAV